MRRFESLVMSVNEPMTDGTLWIRQKKNTIKDTATNTIPPAGMSIWWYGERGWMPLVDLDTRYNLHDAYAKEGVEDPIDITVVSKPEVGIVDITMTYSIYDATRELANNANLVNETGLKYHVDDLQSQIDALAERVTSLEERMTEIENRVSVLEPKVSKLQTDVSTLESRTDTLESTSQQHDASIKSLQSSIQSNSSKIDANTTAIEQLKTQIAALSTGT